MENKDFNTHLQSGIEICFFPPNTGNIFITYLLLTTIEEKK